MPIISNINSISIISSYRTQSSVIDPTQVYNFTVTSFNNFQNLYTYQYFDSNNNLLFSYQTTSNYIIITPDFTPKELFNSVSFKFF